MVPGLQQALNDCTDPMFECLAAIFGRMHPLVFMMIELLALKAISSKYRCEMGVFSSDNQVFVDLVLIGSSAFYPNCGLGLTVYNTL